MDLILAQKPFWVISWVKINFPFPKICSPTPKHTIDILDKENLILFIQKKFF